MTKSADFRPKTDDELKSEVLELRKEQLNLRFQAVTGEVTNTSRIRVVRRDIAKIKTILTERKKA